MAIPFKAEAIMALMQAAVEADRKKRGAAPLEPEHQKVVDEFRKRLVASLPNVEKTRT